MRIPITESKARRDGFSVIIILTLLALVMIFIGANVRALNNLHREMQTIEQKQIRRLNPDATHLPSPSGAVPPGQNAQSQ